MAGVRGVRPLPRVGVRPVWSSPAARRQEQQGEQRITGRLVAVDGEHENVAVASMSDEEGVEFVLF